MKSKFHTQVVENLDLITGITLSVVIASLGIVGVVSPQLLSAAVLAVLALQLGVVAHLRGQLHAYAKLSRDQAPVLRQLHEWLSGKGSVASVYRHDYPDVSSEIAEAMAIDILAGLSFKTTIAVFATAIETALQRGAIVRAVCPNPENASLMEAAAVASSHRTMGSEAADDVRMNLHLAKHLRDLSADLDGELQIRVVDTLPGVGILRVQGQAGARVYVKMMLIGAAWGGYPVLCLSESIDGNLCGDLERAFDMAWSRSRPFE
jgi:hypothetical protein